MCICTVANADQGAGSRHAGSGVGIKVGRQRFRVEGNLIKEDPGTLARKLLVVVGRIDALPVADRHLKVHLEALVAAEEAGAYELNHAEVFHGLILERVTGKHHAPQRPKAQDETRNVRSPAPNAMALVQDHQI
jgi:hypothetical protein